MKAFASYDGTRLAYDEVGSGSRLVCLPGGPGRASAYLEDLGGLVSSRTLIRLDGRATGRSEVPADPTTLRYDRLAADVEALRCELGEDQLDLLAHSAGCLTAQAWAAAHPERVRSLVLVTPSGRLQGSAYGDLANLIAARAHEPWYADARAALDALDDCTPAERQGLLRAIRPFMYGTWDERTQEHAASADRQSSRRAEMGFRAADGDVDVKGMLAALGRLSAAVLVLAGGRDALTGIEAAEDVAACFATAQLVTLPSAGHFPWVDDPEGFRDAVADFLARR